MTDAPRFAELTLADADWLVQAALTIGVERGFASMSVAIVGVTGEPIVLRRADGAMPLTGRIAMAKARTALVSARPSREIEVLPQSITDSIVALYGGDFVPRAGGVLVTGGGVILGAAGASGGLADEDEEVVRVAVERWQLHVAGDSPP